MSGKRVEYRNHGDSLLTIGPGGPWGPSPPFKPAGPWKQRTARGLDLIQRRLPLNAIERRSVITAAKWAVEWKCARVPVSAHMWTDVDAKKKVTQWWAICNVWIVPKRVKKKIAFVQLASLRTRVLKLHPLTVLHLKISLSRSHLGQSFSFLEMNGTNYVQQRQHFIQMPLFSFFVYSCKEKLHNCTNHILVNNSCKTEKSTIHRKSKVQPKSLTLSFWFQHFKRYPMEAQRVTLKRINWHQMEQEIHLYFDSNPGAFLWGVCVFCQGAPASSHTQRHARLTG